MAWWRRRSWGRPVVMLIVCYVALLLPVLGFVNIFFMQYSLVADHWQYAAMIVPCAAVAALLTTLGRRLPPLSRLGRGAGGEGSLPPLARSGRGAGGRAFSARRSAAMPSRSHCWRSWPRHLPSEPDVRRRGDALSDDARTESNLLAGAEQFRQSVVGQGQILLGKAGAMTRRPAIDEAIAHYHQALKAKPGNADTHLNLGNALARLGRIDEAIDEFQQALDAKPDLRRCRVQPRPRAGAARTLRRGDIVAITPL